MKCSRFVVFLSFLITMIAFSSAARAETTSTNHSYMISSYPFLDNIEKSGLNFSSTTRKWMNRWRDLDLENTSLYNFPELSGTTSVNLKITKIDQTESKGYKSMGAFVALNDSGNPNAEIAYFHLAVILGVDEFFRPATKYELGPRAKEEFKKILVATELKGSIRNLNKKNILKEISLPGNLKGCLKAKKEDNLAYLEDMVKTSWPGVGKVKLNHPVIKLIQAQNAQPRLGMRLLLKPNFEGDEKVLAREFSIILTLDTVFGQYDRFSGGNINLRNDDQNNTHFYAADNGGTDIVDSVNHSVNMTKKFNRFDKNVIEKLRELNTFLIDPSIGFLDYKDADKFVIDLGLYFRFSSARYVEALKKNLAVLLKHVESTEKEYHSSAYFQD